MLTPIKMCFGIVFLIILTGCVQKHTEVTTTIPKKQNPIIKKETNQILKNPISKSPVTKHISYKYCYKHTKIMRYASEYIEKEFEKGYFIQKDIVGAKAQLFLIENKSPSIFAQNINAAQESYDKQYKLAKDNKCNLKKFAVSPLSKVKNTIKSLEKEKAKK
ncbi:MAG: hypothetical protein C0625_12900 [Arcobacter sp.]|nr:MAG: hypothetical protein C0625_12900 [Arcobacter sp.]